MKRQGYSQWQRGRQPSSRRVSTWSLIALVVILGAGVLSACAPAAGQAQAQQNKAKLDAELTHARNDLGIPETMLAPITKQETKIANGEGGWNYNYKDAATNYALLYTQLTGVEQTATDTLRKQAGLDLQAFATALQERQNDGFVEADAYQARLGQAQQAFNKAKTPGDYAAVDTIAVQQTQALRSMWPAYQKLLDFQKVLKALGATGIDASLAQTQYNQDLQTFRDAASAERYETLQQIIDGQILQLMADQSEGLPYIGTSLLASFQDRINLLKSYGSDVSQFQQQHDQDAKALAAARNLRDYQKLAQSINSHVAAMALPLIKGKAYHDLNTLKSLVAWANNEKNLVVTDVFDGSKWPAAYEYADCPTNGLQDVTNVLNAAKTQDDYQASDDNINILITNLRAMIDNMKDKTPYNQPHATDLQLLQTYGIQQGRVMVVSLREQATRLYENGKLVYSSLVTTGRPELPSVPGLHTAMYKGEHLVFTSPEPKGSPLWYAPTPINYGILYANWGFFVHDGWWRSEFGPSTNLPHYDPAAFDGGSHGCINLPLSNMKYVYDWLPQGAPILVY